MNKISESDEHLCYCGSGVSHGECCAPIIRGDCPAASAEQLMRSRYSAYVIENEDYLLESWHPDTRPHSLRLSDDGLHWTKLAICRCQRGQPGDRTGRVEFIARYVHTGVPGEVHEDSRFVFEQGRWLYLGGDLKTARKPGRNDPCPCGSGKKYKKCCAG